jgi:hypothetical protein
MPSREPFSLIAGTATATNIAAALGTLSGFESIVLKANPANTDTVFVGDASSQPFPLMSGDSIGLAVDRLSIIYVLATSGSPGVAWLVAK